MSGHTQLSPVVRHKHLLTERVHELIASLWPAGAISNSIPVVILLVWWLGRGNMCCLFPFAAGAFIFTPRWAFWIWWAASTAAAHLLNNFNLCSQLWNKRNSSGWYHKQGPMKFWKRMCKCNNFVKYSLSHQNISHERARQEGKPKNPENFFTYCCS